MLGMRCRCAENTVGDTGDWYVLLDSVTNRYGNDILLPARLSTLRGLTAAWMYWAEFAIWKVTLDL